MNEKKLNPDTLDDNQRYDFLLHLYDQLWNSINSHLFVVWQSIGTLVASIALLALVEKNVITMSLAIAVIFVLSGWLIANVFDAGFWYNRNLLIIGNIEKQFLREDDDRQIVYYFVKHRDRNNLIKHFQIQLSLGIVTIVLFAAYHFVELFIPAYNSKNITFELLLPYIILAIVIVLLIILKKKADKDYGTLLKFSPGIEVKSALPPELVAHHKVE